MPREGKDCTNAAASHERLGHPNLEEARKGPPPEAWEGDSPPTLRFGTWSLQSCLKPPSGRFLQPRKCRQGPSRGGVAGRSPRSKETNT